MTDGIEQAADKMLAHVEGGVATMTFNNPQKRNAVSLDMWKAADAIMSRFAADPAVRVVVITGAGDKAFVSGADISRFDDERSEAAAVQSYNAAVEAIYDSIHRFPKPTIARIRGFCIGGGLGLAACCDIRVATEGSRFALPAARLGLGYGFKALRRLVEVTGTAAAKEIFFTARQFSAAEALGMGLVNRVVAEDALDGFVADYAHAVADNAPLTLGTAKFVFNELAKDPDERDLAGCAEHVRACFASEDYREGKRAFMEKRRPVFQGR